MREVAVQAGLKAQLFEQLLFGFVETGGKGNDIWGGKDERDYILYVSDKLKKNFPVICKEKQIMYKLKLHTGRCLNASLQSESLLQCSFLPLVQNIMENLPCIFVFDSFQFTLPTPEQTPGL